MCVCVCVCVVCVPLPLLSPPVFLIIHVEYVRGISCVQNSLCIGGSDGSVLVFNVSSKAVDYCQELRGCHSAVCDLETLSDGRLSSCHEDGSIIIWTNPLKSGDESRVEIQQPT